MNPEQLHDALNQLPDDLLAETDRLRQPNPKAIPWKKILPMAACLALVAGALAISMPLLQRKGVMADNAESIQEAAPQAPASVMETVAASASEAPEEAVPENIGAPLAPEAVQEEPGHGARDIPVAAYTFWYTGEPGESQVEIISSLAQLENSGLLTDDVDVSAYDEAWFNENQLIFFLTDAASSSIRYDIQRIRETAPGCWTLTGSRLVPHWQTEDMTHQLILVELPRMVEPEDTVLLELTLVIE